MLQPERLCVDTPMDLAAFYLLQAKSPFVLTLVFFNLSLRLIRYHFLGAPHVPTVVQL